MTALSARDMIIRLIEDNNMSRQAVLELLNEVRPPSSNYKLDDAMTWLEDQLDVGEAQSKHIRTRATKAGINPTTLYRAAIELGVKKKLTGYGRRKRSFWRLR